MRTAAWYGDRPLDLDFPANWDVEIVRPKTPTPVAGSAIAAAIENPIGQPSLRRLAKGKQRPVVIIDDPNRPTPTDRILPFVLDCFENPARVTVVVATGTHGAPAAAALERKTGNVSCRVVVHDARRGALNSEVAASDFVMGIGGVYPNHTAGFGGGSKLALGVLGFEQIESLHYRHQGAGWGGALGSSFRAELDDIARRIGLNTVVSAQVDSDRALVRIVSGDHFSYHAGEAVYAQRVFGGPDPAGVDVVISNAYPNDLSLTFARMKGMTPLSRCGEGVSRIAIASCPEGLGFHGLFPFLNAPKHHRMQSNWRKITRLSPRVLARKVAERVRRRPTQTARNQVWVYRPGEHPATLPERAGDLIVTSSWAQILEAVAREHPGKSRLSVLIYACAPLQPLVRVAVPDGAESKVDLESIAVGELGTKPDRTTKSF